MDTWRIEPYMVKSVGSWRKPHRGRRRAAPCQGWAFPRPRNRRHRAGGPHRARPGSPRGRGEPFLLPDVWSESAGHPRPAVLRPRQRAVEHPALRRFLEEVIPQHRAIEGYEVEHKFPTIGRRTMLLNARQVLEEEHPDSTLLLLAIEDITQRRDTEREKDELLRQKEMLLQEMQHRVANSLQIIASILMLKARTVQSEETRQHLRDAHQRVMSVATVQQQLQPSGLGDRIEVGPYLSKLCDSLRNSMIDHSSPHSLLVQAATGTVESSQAVSLGLVTTELVINALKHAFR